MKPLVATISLILMLTAPLAAVAKDGGCCSGSCKAGACTSMTCKDYSGIIKSQGSGFVLVEGTGKTLHLMAINMNFKQYVGQRVHVSGRCLAPESTSLHVSAVTLAKANS